MINVMGYLTEKNFTKCFKTKLLFTCLLCAGNVEGSVTVSFDTLYTGPLPPSADIAGQPPPSAWDLIQRVYRLQKHWDRDIMTIITGICWCNKHWDRDTGVTNTFYSFRSSNHTDITKLHLLLDGSYC